jgi:hypothetical protein
MTDKLDPRTVVLLLVTALLMTVLACVLVISTSPAPTSNEFTATTNTAEITKTIPPTPTPTPTATPCTQGQAEYDAVRAFNYRGAYFAANPKLRPNAPQIVVQHAVPVEVILRRPCLFSEEELNNAANMRAIPSRLDDTLHNSTIKKAWNEFWRTKPNATRDEVIAEKDRLDKLHDLADLAYKAFKVSR